MQLFHKTHLPVYEISHVCSYTVSFKKSKCEMQMLKIQAMRIRGWSQLITYLVRYFLLSHALIIKYNLY